MLKTRKALLAAAVAVPLAIAGCSQGTQQANNGSAANGGNNDGEVMLRFWVADSAFESDDSPGQQMVRAFNEKYKGKIRVEAKYAPWEAHNTAIQAAFASGDEPDLFQMPLGAQISDYASKKLIQPVTGLVSDNWKNQFYEGSFTEGVNQFDGNIYAWPTTGPSLSYMLFYNKEVLEKAGLEPKAPKTWDELREMAQTVTKQGKGDIYGITFGGGTPARFTQLVAAGFAVGAGKGDSPFEGFNFIQGKYDLDSKAWVDAVNYLLTLKKDGSILPSSFTMKTTEADAMFAQGKAAFLLGGRWGLGNLKTQNPDLKFGSAITPTPDGSTPKYGYTLAVPERGFVVAKNTKHPKEVGIFIEEGLTSKEFFASFLKKGIALTPIPEVNNDESNYAFPELKEFVQVHNDSWILGPDPVGRNPDLASISNKIGGLLQEKMKPNTGEVLQSILNGTVTNVEETLKAHNDKLNKNLQDTVQKAKEDGAKVDMADFHFPEWDGVSNYKK